MVAGLHARQGVEMAHEGTGPVTDRNVPEAHRALRVRYIL